ncbi:hypothetical protein [Agrobacterium tumefaciens]|uniref:hypothetical protein n=1 Tax=Agrobacterium tumefaciens TaxID=358 RepID=UPI0004597AE7|nr:hypothetical protein [Agrobacterium tumefaciens]CDN93414.1 hypothetical protein BN949_02568 [Agrobacterium tumefaciens]
MTVNFRTLPQPVPGAADFGSLRPTDEEMAIFNSQTLVAWTRASINYEQSRIVDRARGVSFNKIPRSPMPPIVRPTNGMYNNKPYIEITDIFLNPPELRSGEDVLPSSGSYTFAWVGHWKTGTGSNYYFFGNDAESSPLTFAVGVNQSNGRIQIKHSENVIFNTGVGAFTPVSNVPFLAIVGYDSTAGRMRVRANRGLSDQQRTGVTGTIGAARKLAIGASGGDAFGRANALRGGGIAEFMVFNSYILDNATLVSQVEKVLGDRYGFAAH